MIATGVGVSDVGVGEGVEAEVGLGVEVGEGDGTDVGRLSGVGDGLGGEAGVVSAMEGVSGGGDVDSTGCICAVGSGVGAWPHPPSVRVAARARSAAARVNPRNFVNENLISGEGRE